MKEEEIVAEMKKLNDEIQSLERKKMYEWQDKQYIILNIQWGKIKKAIYQRYYKEYHLRYRNKNQIISYVKQGIKHGLGLKNLKGLDYIDLEGIISKFIQEDLERIKEFDKIEKQMGVIRVKYEKQRKEINSELDIIQSKLDRLSKLIKKDVKEEDEVRLKLENIDKYTDRIREEINRRMVMESLK